MYKMYLSVYIGCISLFKVVIEGSAILIADERINLGISNLQANRKPHNIRYDRDTVLKLLD
jgi:alanine-alpha-ketoisovalerate/valine-pyruvate aminotransferase